ncbi:MAG: hypothetical protein ABSH51_27340 [Solirubrobacteraceae bacterium]
MAPGAACAPASYDSLALVSPGPASYTSRSVQFTAQDGSPISGLPAATLDASGSVGLAGLGLTGLPQFLVTLAGEAAPLTSATATLTWTGVYDPACLGNGITAPSPTTTTTSLARRRSDRREHRRHHRTAVTDAATLAGQTATAGGTVTYSVYADSQCARKVGSLVVAVANGSVPNSAPVTLSAPGVYYWVATYSGDGANTGYKGPMAARPSPWPARSRRAVRGRRAGRPPRSRRRPEAPV